MKNALIVSKSTNTAKTISDILRQDCGFSVISCVLSAAEARHTFSSAEYELAVICTPLEDEFGLELAAEMSRAHGASVIIIANADVAEEVQKKVSASGAFVLSRPLTKITLIQAVQYVKITRVEMLRLREENAELERKLNETKIIDRAKCVLIQYLRISEEQAHRQIQKQAMDKRVKQIDVAKDILKTYEN